MTATIYETPPEGTPWRDPEQLYRKCWACRGHGRLPWGEDTQGRPCFACRGVGFIPAGCTVEDVAELVDLSLSWFQPDGTVCRLATADEVVRRRKEAAVELAALKRVAAQEMPLP